VGALLGYSFSSMYTTYGNSIQLYFAEDWGGGDYQSWSGTEVQSAYSEWAVISNVVSLIFVPLAGRMVDRCGSLFIMYVAACFFAAQSTALALLPPSQMLFTVVWATGSTPPLLFITALMPFFLQLLPDPVKITRDAGFLMVLSGASNALTVVVYGSILVGSGTTDKLMLGDRKQIPLEGYRTFFAASNVVAVLAPTAFHFAARCFPTTIRRHTTLV